MRDEEKSNEQLVEEVVRLRRRLAQMRALDIDREQTEETYRENAARLQAILDTTVDGIITIDEDSIVQSFNKAAEQIFGYSAGEVMGNNVSMLMPSPYRENHDRYVADYLRTGNRKIIGIGREAKGQRKDGSTFPLYLAVSEVWVKEKRLFTGILRDISAFKQAMDEIRSVARFPDENPYPILRVGSDGKLLYANAGSKPLLETLECGVGQYLADPWKSIILESLSSGIGRELEIQCGDITYSLVLTPILNADDVNVYGRNITERKRAEEELKSYRDHLEEMVVERTRDLETAQKALIQKEKLKTLGSIAAELAHEIRNPLMSIGGFARRLKEKLPDVADVEIILNESIRLEKILHRIKNYLKPVEMRPQECSVNEIIEESIDFISSELDREGILLDLNLAPGLPAAYVDPGILIQVLVNVIRNAAKFMEVGRRLTIETFETDQNVQVYVHAPVPGARLQDPEHIFLPFGEDGSTISLPLCFRLLKDMGGLLSFKQEKGSVMFAASLLKALQPKSEVR